MPLLSLMYITYSEPTIYTEVGPLHTNASNEQQFFLRIMLPVQFPLHEPYFDLTPIEITHTKLTH